MKGKTMNNVIQDKATDITRVSLPVLEVDKIALETSPIRRDFGELNMIRVEETDMNMDDLISRIGVEITPFQQSATQRILSSLQLRLPSLDALAKSVVKIVKATTDLTVNLMTSVFRESQSLEQEELQRDQVDREERDRKQHEQEVMTRKVVTESTPQSRTVQEVDGRGRVLRVTTTGPSNADQQFNTPSANR